VPAACSAARKSRLTCEYQCHSQTRRSWAWRRALTAERACDETASHLLDGRFHGLASIWCSKELLTTGSAQQGRRHAIGVLMLTVPPRAQELRSGVPISSRLRGRGAAGAGGFEGQHARARERKPLDGLVIGVSKRRCGARQWRLANPSRRHNRAGSAWPNSEHKRAAKEDIDEAF
jgi:hypothetical protein